MYEAQVYFALPVAFLSIVPLAAPLHALFTRRLQSYLNINHNFISSIKMGYILLSMMWNEFSELFSVYQIKIWHQLPLVSQIDQRNETKMYENNTLHHTTSSHEKSAL